MPVYAYACKSCGHALDVRQSFTEDALTVCPECAGPLRKQFNTVGVVFKGSGFYRTDSRSGASSGPSPAPSSGASAKDAAPAAAASSSASAATGASPA